MTVLLEIIVIKVLLECRSTLFVVTLIFMTALHCLSVLLESIESLCAQNLIIVGGECAA